MKCKPTQCAICFDSFQWKDILKKHLFRNHLNYQQEGQQIVCEFGCLDIMVTKKSLSKSHCSSAWDPNLMMHFPCPVLHSLCCIVAGQLAPSTGRSSLYYNHQELHLS